MAQVTDQSNPTTTVRNSQARTPRMYRRTQKPTKHRLVAHTWRTRQDPFVLVWEKVQSRLEQDPSLHVKAIFQWLQQTYPGQFHDGQLRTLQRRVKAWRLAQARFGEGVIHPMVVDTPGDGLKPDFVDGDRHVWKINYSIMPISLAAGTRVCSWSHPSGAVCSMVSAAVSGQGHAATR